MTTPFTHKELGLVWLALGLCGVLALLLFAWWLAHHPPKVTPTSQPKYTDALRHRLNGKRFSERQTIFGTASATEFDRHGIGYSWSAARWKTRRQSQRKKAMSIRSTRLWMACPSLPEQMP